METVIDESSQEVKINHHYPTALTKKKTRTRTRRKKAKARVTEVKRMSRRVSMTR
jgi:hypothetical protein